MTKLAECDDPKRGVVKGHPIKFIRGHHGRITKGPYGPYKKTRERAELDQPNPTGICWCGCGGITPIAKETNARDQSLKGYHIRFIPHHGKRPKKPMWRVEDRGYKTPCWIFQWYTDRAGYGKMCRDGKSQSSHRWMYEKIFGPIPEGKHLDHLCFQPPCMNPDHLEPVTPRVNNDRRRHIKLSPEKAPVIRQLHEWGASMADIARLFGVKPNMIYMVLSGRSWKPRD